MTEIQQIEQNISKLLGYEISLQDENNFFTMMKKINIRGFDKFKLEKDFWLTVILHRIAKEIPEITFKGGTCLNKIYFPYFRLSEDLDFSISIEDSLVNTNGKRETFAQKIREKIKHLTTTLGWTLNNDEQHHKKAQGNENLKKKEYTYLKYVLTYPSLYNQSKQSIKIEITYTNKQHFPGKYKQIQSIFIDPLLENNLFNNQDIKCLTLEEMITEKCRATLTRREPAIRDFFDLRYIQTQGVDIFTHKEIIIAKCDEVSERKRSLNGQYDNLEKQITTHLIPVIDDIGNFDLKTIYEQIERLQKELFG